MPQSNVQKKLARVSEINKDLRRLMEDTTIQGPRMPSEKAPSGLKEFLHRESVELQELYDLICQGYDCGCKGPHFANVGCHCSSCQTPFASLSLEKDHWTPELLFMSKKKITQIDEASDCLASPEMDQSHNPVPNKKAPKARYYQMKHGISLDS